MFQYVWSERGELRRLAATKNNPLNSSASLSIRLNEKALESPALFSAGLFDIYDCRFSIDDWRLLMEVHSGHESLVMMSPHDHTNRETKSAIGNRKSAYVHIPRHIKRAHRRL